MLSERTGLGKSCGIIVKTDVTFQLPNHKCNCQLKYKTSFQLLQWY